MQIYDKIKKLCDSKGITIAELERKVDISNGSVTKWKSFMPKADTLLNVAHYLGCSIEYLLDFAGESSDNVTISNYELEILKKYRLLDPRGQQAVIDTLNREYRYTKHPVTLKIAARGGGLDGNSITDKVAEEALELIDEVAEKDKNIL